MPSDSKGRKLAVVQGSMCRKDGGLSVPMSSSTTLIGSMATILAIITAYPCLFRRAGLGLRGINEWR